MSTFHLSRRLCCAVLISMLAACGTAPEQTAPAVGGTPAAPVAVPVRPPAAEPAAGAPPALEAPALPREFRAAWVATVANIDWPSRRDLSSARQQAEALALLDLAAQMKLNAIILQVRPGADAVYPSEIEPWSEFLTGEQGRAPAPWYDPLQFWVEQAHRRGLELHAWFNPYRARSANGKAALSPRHIAKTHPEAVKSYGDMLWMDPAEPAAVAQTLAVIGDVVRRYDIDGVHIDDYFYPYPVKNGNGSELDFPDEPAWQAYRAGGGQLERPAWRRQQVNQLVQAIHQRVHQEKSWVKFGISPFGIGRPEWQASGIAGFSQYDKLYADVELWLQQGWLDYLAPQLYWPLEQSAQAFTVLHDYWLTQNTLGRHVWPGLYTSRIDGTDKPWPAQEILNQVDASRRAAGAGHIHFSITPLLQNRQHIRERLAAEKYQDTAVVPPSPWLAPLPGAAAPRLERRCVQQQCSLHLLERPPHALWLAVWKRYAQRWVLTLHSTDWPDIALARDPQLGEPRQVVVSAIDRNGAEGPRTGVPLP